MKKEKENSVSRSAADREKELEVFTDNIRKQLEDSGYEYMFVICDGGDNLEERHGLLGLKGKVHVMAEMIFCAAEQGNKALQGIVEHLLYNFARRVTETAKQIRRQSDDTQYS